MFAQKILRIQQHLQTHNLDRLIIGNAGHQISDDLLYYLFLKKIEYGFLSIPAHGKPTFYAIEFEMAEFSDYANTCDVLPLRSISEIITHTAGKHEQIAFRPSAFPYKLYEQITKETECTLVPLPEDHWITVIKSDQEIARIKSACAITDDIFSALLDAWHAFKTEKDASDFLLRHMLAQGTEPSFPPIIASGVHAAHPHHVSGPSPLLPGFCVIDMGVRYHGYCSDMTRTIFIGEPTQKDRELYEHVRRTQAQTIKQAVVGTQVNTLDRFCRTALGGDLNREFIHALGHGLGTQVHEFPSVSGKQDTVLEKDMVITIEPGIYREQAYGIRIEDDIVITDHEPVVLTQSTKELLAL